MLEGLNKIQWKTLQHRHGSAENIPEFLLDLLSSNKKNQSSATLRLFDTLWYHGRVYEATVHTVPFLYEVIESPQCSEKFSLVWLLFLIANGNSVYPGHPSEEKQTEKGAVWVDQAHEAVRRGVKTILSLLNDKNKDLRLPVLLLLASIPEEAESIKPQLFSLLSEEKNDEVRAGLGLALVLLGDLHLEAFQCQNTNLPLVLLENLAKAYIQDHQMRATVYQAIEHCFLSTMERKDKDWYFDEKIFLESIRPNPN